MLYGGLIVCVSGSDFIRKITQVALFAVKLDISPPFFRVFVPPDPLVSAGPVLLGSLILLVSPIRADTQVVATIVKPVTVHMIH